jgi:hypothetical protein
MNIIQKYVIKSKYYLQKRKQLKNYNTIKIKKDKTDLEKFEPVRRIGYLEIEF